MAIPKTRYRSHSLRLWLGLSAIILAVCFYVYRFNPGSEGLFWHCPVRALTGWYCPGCGGQRALHHLMHLRLLDAASSNLIAVTLAVLFVPGVAYTIWRKRPPVEVLARTPIPVVFAAGVAIVLYGVIRNLPTATGIWLAP